MSDRVPHPAREIQAALRAVAEARATIGGILDGLEAQLHTALRHARASETEGKHYRLITGSKSSLSMDCITKV